MKKITSKRPRIFVPPRHGSLYPGVEIRCIAAISKDDTERERWGMNYKTGFLCWPVRFVAAFRESDEARNQNSGGKIWREMPRLPTIFTNATSREKTVT